MGGRIELRFLYYDSILEISKGQTIRNYGALLARIATLRAIDQLRKRYSRRTLNVDTIDVVVLPNENTDSLQQAQDSQLTLELRKALTQLAPVEAETVCLRYFNDMSYRQIAKELNIKSNTVGVLLNRAKKKLRNILEPAAKTKDW